MLPSHVGRSDEAQEHVSSVLSPRTAPPYAFRTTGQPLYHVSYPTEKLRSINVEFRGDGLDKRV